MSSNSNNSKRTASNPQDCDQSRLLLRGFRELEAALAVIPADMKSELLEALRRCPALFETESAPLKFLLREDWNATAAAQRLTSYWRIRVEIFGDRAFYPLKAGADGALFPEDVDGLLTGYISVLPNTSNGHSVFSFDLSRLVSTCAPSVDSRLRCLYYIANLVSENPRSTTEGVIILHFLDKLGAIFQQGQPRRPKEVFRMAFPVRLRKIYIVHCPEETDATGFLVKLLPSALSFVGSFYSDIVEPVFGNSRQEVLAKLEQIGLLPAGIPIKLGGTWDSCAALASNLAPGAKPPPTTNVDTSNKVKKMNQQNLLDILDNSISTDANADAFREARHRTPFLVSLESPGERFLAVSDNNFVAAANRLVSYWDVRLDLFGERSLLPLTLSGLDALVLEDIAHLDRGFVAVLPDDSQSRPVICCDYTRVEPIPSAALRKSQLRALFYILQVVSQHAKADTEGVVLLLVLPPQKHLDSEPAPMSFILQAMPVRLHMVHIIYSGTPGTASGFTNHDPEVQAVVKALGTVASGKTLLLTENAERSMVSRLEAFGLRRLGLPEAIGGSWCYTIEIPRWKYERCTIERQRISELSYGIDSDDSASEQPLSRVQPRDEGHEHEMLPSSISIGKRMVTETEAMIKQGLGDLEEALALLPPEHTEALLEARAKVPELAEKEAPPLRFLRFESYNTWAAATRLAKYWQTRKELFRDRAFLPMNQSGEGTLTREDVTTFAAGYFVLLPYDEKGRTVVCYDAERMTDRTKDVRMRLTFYLWSIVGENEMTQREGCKVLLITRNVQRDPITSQCVNIVLEVLPVRFYGLYMCNVPSVSERTTFQQKFVPLFLKLILILSKRTIVLVDDTKEGLLDKLENHELVREGLPECIGGTWSYDEFARWQEMRTRYEWELPSVGMRSAAIPHLPEYTVRPRSQLTEPEKVERKRRLNVLNSRRKRDRTRVEVAVFGSQVSELKTQNRQLHDENERLDRLLRAAKSHVALLGGSDQTADAKLPVDPQLSSVVPSAYQSISTNGTTQVGLSTNAEQCLVLEQSLIQQVLLKQSLDTLLHEKNMPKAGPAIDPSNFSTFFSNFSNLSQPGVRETPDPAKRQKIS